MRKILPTFGGLALMLGLAVTPANGQQPADHSMEIYKGAKWESVAPSDDQLKADRDRAFERQRHTMRMLLYGYTTTYPTSLYPATLYGGYYYGPYGFPLSGYYGWGWGRAATAVGSTTYALPPDGGR
jgi:hypothetical protein